MDHVTRSGLPALLGVAVLMLGCAVVRAGDDAPATDESRGARVTWHDGFVAETGDRDFRVHVGGRAEFDNSWFTQDANLLLGPTEETTLKDGSLFRRARLRADGLLWGWIDFVTEVNFANIQDASNVDNAPVQVGSVGLTDFYLTFRDLPIVGNVRLGHFKAPVGLERYSSSNAWYYMERSSLYDAFLGPNNYQDGILLFDSYLDERITAAASLTRIGKSTVQSFGFGAQDGAYAVAARVTGLPWYADEGRRLLHVGIGWQHQALVGQQFNIASRPLLRAGSGSGSDTPNVVFTGAFFTPAGADVLDVECAAVVGPWSLSGEWALVRGGDVFDSQQNGAFFGPHGSVTYQAFYVETGWFVTSGDHRRYDRANGAWARTIPVANANLSRSAADRGPGAVQLLARWTYLDLISGDPVLTPASGGARAGRQQDVNLGVNWYLNPQVWVMVNWVMTHLDSVVPGASGDFQGLGARIHIDF